MFSLFRTPEREPKYKWVGPIIEESVYPYRLKTKTDRIQTLEELKARKKISTRFAGSIPSCLKRLGFENLEQSATESEQLYKMIFNGRTEIIVGDTDSGVAYYMKKLGFDLAALERIPIEIFRSELFIAFSQDSEDRVVEAWAKAVKKLKDTGVIQQILLKYQ